MNPIEEKISDYFRTCDPSILNAKDIRVLGEVYVNDRVSEILSEIRKSVIQDNRKSHEYIFMARDLPLTDPIEGMLEDNDLSVINVLREKGFSIDYKLTGRNLDKIKAIITWS